MRNKINKNVRLGMLLVCLIGILIYQSCSMFDRPSYVGDRQEIESYRRTVNILSDGELGDPTISIGFIKAKDFESKETLGTCSWFYSNFSFRISVNIDSWQYLTEKEKVLLVAHEYAHCQCKKFAHIDTLLKDNCPANYMNSRLPSELCMNRHSKRYLDQIRRGCREFNK